MDGWLSSITVWFLGLFKKVFTGLVDFIHDGLLWLFWNCLDAIATALVAIPVPAFFSQGIDVGTLFSAFPPLALYIISKLHLGQAFAVLAAGIAFRLGRKLFTLGQW